MIKPILSVAVLAALTGCASRESISSGAVGCPPSEVKVTDANMGWSTNTWTATCRGKTFYCTNSEMAGLNCAPALTKQ